MNSLQTRGLHWIHAAGPGVSTSVDRKTTVSGHARARLRLAANTPRPRVRCYYCKWMCPFSGLGCEPFAPSRNRKNGHLECRRILCSKIVELIKLDSKNYEDWDETNKDHCPASYAFSTRIIMNYALTHLWMDSGCFWYVTTLWVIFQQSDHLTETLQCPRCGAWAASRVKNQLLAVICQTGAVKSCTPNSNNHKTEDGPLSIDSFMGPNMFTNHPFYDWWSFIILFRRCWSRPTSIPGVTM
jgi:hypothetical protein